MKREVPLLIAFIVGVIMIASYFVPHWPFPQLQETFTNWVSIIAAFAIFLGMINLIRIHGNRISRGSRGWFYSATLLTGLFVTMFAGFWYGVDQKYTVPLALNADQNLALRNALARLEAPAKDEAEKRANLRSAANLAAPVLGTDNPFVAEASLKDFRAAQEKAADGTVTSLDVKHPNPYQWIFLFLFSPMQATMFSILAFYIASAAYRAFKAKTRESTLLLGAAFLVMLGRVPIGSSIWGGFGAVADWIMQVPNTAGQRAILIGAALGIVSTALRILLGIERSYMGAE